MSLKIKSVVWYWTFNKSAISLFLISNLKYSIFNKLLKLPDETLLYPAHDYKGEKVSTIGKEKKQNPRLQVSSVNEYIKIMNNLYLKKPAEIESNVSRNINLGG